MRSSNSKGEAVVNGDGVPIQNGIVSKEALDTIEARHLAEKVVADVVRLASDEVNQREKKQCLARLPTIQVDTVSSPPLSPDENSLDESSVQLEIVEDQTPDLTSEEVQEDLKRYLEDILAKAMVVAQKKLQFVGVPSSDEDEEDVQPGPSANQRDLEAERRIKEEEIRKEAEKEAERKAEEERLEQEIREAATKVVEEVLEKASEAVAERLEKEATPPSPALPTFQIDTVVSAPPSPEREPPKPVTQKKWTFKMAEEPKPLMKFDDAPADVKEVASNFVKEIVDMAVTKAMEKENIVPTVPFNFEDVDLMKTNGPWYVRMREAFVRVLRTACFCTPRRGET